MANGALEIYLKSENAEYTLHNEPYISFTWISAVKAMFT